MREFKYNVVHLIHAVKDRPCLWDRTLEVYKDRTERRDAWEEVFKILDENYEEMNSEDKRMTGELILNKWTNVRDTFVKTLKTKMGRPRRKYVLYDHLKFLIKVITAQDIDLSEIPEEDYAGFSTDDSYLKSEDTVKEGKSHRKRIKKDYNEEEPKKSKDLDKSDMDFVEVEEYNDPRVMNEDEAFFASLLPTVVKYSEDERLEFRIEVLAVMKRIKEKRNWSCNM